MQATVPLNLKHSVEFFKSCRVSRSYIKSITIRQKSDVLIQPVLKIKLIGYVDRKKITRTVLCGQPVFRQVMASFGNTDDEAWVLDDEIMFKEKTIKEIFQSFLKSEMCKSQVKKENGIAKNRLVDQLCREVSDRFSLLLSFPEADDIIPSLYKQAQVERVLKS